ncbi:MAG: GTP-binding protein, partial [Clostridia bacterium]|nr:GTP-binding protein [Clostridia bacterium]
PDDEDDDEHECCHHHPDDDEDEHECCRHHHDDEDEEHEHHHHHHGHDADEVFTSWGRETTRTYTPDQIEQVLSAFDDPDGGCGMILRAKGIVAAPDGRFVHFDYVPGEHDVRFGTPAPVGRLCVIGASLDEARVAELFGVK